MALSESSRASPAKIRPFAQEMIGPPGDGRATGTRFKRRVRSVDHAPIWWEHHWRATDYD